MKIAIFVLACFAVALAAKTPATHNGLNGLVHHEVTSLMANNANLKIADCITQCDAAFEYVSYALSINVLFIRNVSYTVFV